jgi:adenylate cyclase
MLESLPWPKHLKNVPEYAGGHHERMDGKGYPRGLVREQMSVQARIMAIADIFEALTARDRPYKKGKTLSESLHILGKFALNGHIDPDLFDIFVRQKVYLKFGRKNLDAHADRPCRRGGDPGLYAVKLLRRYGARWALGLALTLAALAYVMGVWSSHAIARQDTIIADLRLRLETPVLDPRIVIVDIDTKSLGEVGRFPWSRNVLAKLVDQLAGHYGAAAIGFDVSFPEPDTSSGYAVLDRLAAHELKDVPALRAQLAQLKPALDYDGLFARSLQGRPVVLGYNLAAVQRGVLPQPAFTMADLNGRELVAYSADGYEANLARLQAGGARRRHLHGNLGPTTAWCVLQFAAAADRRRLLSVAVAGHGRRVPGGRHQADAGVRQVRADSGAADAIGCPGRAASAASPSARPAYGRAVPRPGGPQGGAFRYVSAADVLARGG